MDTPEQEFLQLYNIVKQLRGPDGCPWDREQSPETLRSELIEETYECIEAIDDKDVPHIKEELGDVFLLATMIAYMHEQQGLFTVADTLKEIGQKLIRRHPHVFGNSTVANSAEVLEQWSRIKVEQEGRKPKDSILDEVSHAVPPLDRAYRLQKKAAKAGFDWTSLEGVWDKIAEEIEEVKMATTAYNEKEASETKVHLEEELGDLLFSVINLCRYLHIDPSVALNRTNNKFTQRFKTVEREMKTAGKSMTAENLSVMDAFWNKAKEEL